MLPPVFQDWYLEQPLGKFHNLWHSSCTGEAVPGASQEASDPAAARANILLVSGIRLPSLNRCQADGKGAGDILQEPASPSACERGRIPQKGPETVGPRRVGSSFGHTCAVAQGIRVAQSRIHFVILEFPSLQG